MYIYTYTNRSVVIICITIQISVSNFILEVYVILNSHDDICMIIYVHAWMVCPLGIIQNAMFCQV